RRDGLRRLGLAVDSLARWGGLVSRRGGLVARSGGVLVGRGGVPRLGVSTLARNRHPRVGHRCVRRIPNTTSPAVQLTILAINHKSCLTKGLSDLCLCFTTIAAIKIIKTIFVNSDG